MNRNSTQSSLSSQSTWKYEVFLSSCDDDAGKNFTDRLFAALQSKGIFAFKKRDLTSPDRLEAIEHSRLFLVVFSNNYADSTRCLEELAMISQRINQMGITVAPVFYNVDQSEAQKQIGDFGKAFAAHEERFKLDLEKVQRWRLALAQVANLPGWDVRNIPEAEVIDEIIRHVIIKLGHKFSAFADDLIAMESRAEAVENLLDLDSEDVVRVVGIYGTSGIGKTTLATVVYDRISHKFDACCFLSDVSKIYKESSGLMRLQKLLILETIYENPEIWSDHTGTNIISSRFIHLKTLIVVDNVDHPNQLEKLVGNPAWFGKGSRIIITTSDKHTLTEHGMKDGETYEAQTLSGDEAFQFICGKAFKLDDALIDFKEMTCDDSLLQYANTHPLAIRFLCSFLFGRDKANEEVKGVLQASYDGVNQSDVKEIFVDIACFFNGVDEKHAKGILGHCGFNPEIGIGFLCDKSLISIVNGKLWMHVLLQELGCNIARGKFPKDPSRWSRLWLYKDLQVINTGTENVEAIVLNQEDYQEAPLKAEVLSEMTRLRLLILPSVKISGNLNNLSNELRYLSWHNFPFSYLPSSFKPAGLVELIIPDSNIKQLWEDNHCIKKLTKLRSMNLRGSKNLIKTPDFRGFPNLERLILEGCIGLVHLDPSIEFLPKLKLLNLKNCNNLVSLPNNLFHLPNLESLDIEGCIRIVQLDPSIALLPKLKFLNLRNCDLVSVPNNLFFLSGLETLNLAGCSKLAECLDWKTSMEVEVLSNQDFPLLEGDVLEAWNEAFKTKAEVHLAKRERSSTEATCSEVTPVDNSIAKCIVALNDIGDISNEFYMKALEKFENSYWRQIFLSMPCHRKKAWLVTLNEYPVAKCVIALNEIDGISNESYIKALEKFENSYWREIFLTMPHDRKKVWLDCLV